MSNPKYVVGRVAKFNTAFMPWTSASAVWRGRLASPGKAAKTTGLAITLLVVHGISLSFCFMLVNASWPLRLVRPGILRRPRRLKLFKVLLGGNASRPKAGPLKLA